MEKTENRKPKTGGAGTGTVDARRALYAATWICHLPPQETKRPEAEANSGKSGKKVYGRDNTPAAAHTALHFSSHYIKTCHLSSVQSVTICFTQRRTSPTAGYFTNAGTALTQSWQIHRACTVTSWSPTLVRRPVWWMILEVIQSYHVPTECVLSVTITSVSSFRVSKRGGIPPWCCSTCV